MYKLQYSTYDTIEAIFFLRASRWGRDVVVTFSRDRCRRRKLLPRARLAKRDSVAFLSSLKRSAAAQHVSPRGYKPLGFGRTRGSGYKGLPKVLRFGVSLVMASCSACQVGFPRSRLAWIWLGCCTDVDFESTACVRVL